MKMNPAVVERRIVQITHGWESTCPEQTFADRTLEQFKQEMQACLDAKARMAAADAVWDASRRERNAAYAKAAEVMQVVVNSVKGTPKYGENSGVYTAMGFVPKSERSSGLTRRRATGTAKAPAGAS